MGKETDGQDEKREREGERKKGDEKTKKEQEEAVESK